MKKPSILSLQEINDLISKYNSELRKLEYQATKIQEALYDLQRMSVNIEGLQLEAPKTLAEGKFETLEATPAASAEQPATAPKRRGRKKKSETEKKPAAAKSKRGRKPGVKATKQVPKAQPTDQQPEGKRGGYKLSIWDQFILDTLSTKGITLINSEIYNLAKDYAQDNDIDISNVELRGKLSRSIHKLANKRGEIIKVEFPGKGYAYALQNWVDGNGELHQKYQRNWELLGV